jgi:sterol desaturase/sphingolipid hydroxylase (fatty acid hydroxylase superfamily)
MNVEWLNTLWEHYNILGSAAALALIAGITIVGKKLLFLHPDLAEMRRINKEEDKKRWKKEKYPPMVRSSQKVGRNLNITFFLVLLPFCITFEAQPWWRVLLDGFIILMVYDFFYYCAHRFWFHGNGPMRQVHAVHHQARDPSYLDAHYVHPTETFIGLGGYMLTVVVLAAFMGRFQLATIVVTFVIYFQLNQLNHVYFKLDKFPFRLVNWIVAKHHVHHLNMHKGNYATITLFYDKIFGTLD